MECSDVEMISATVQDNQSPEDQSTEDQSTEDQPPEEALVNISGDTDTLSISPSEVNVALDGDKTLEEDRMEEDVDHQVDRPPPQPNLAGMIASSHQPEAAPGPRSETMAEAITLGWNALGQPSQQNREQFLQDYSLRSPTDRAGTYRLVKYPCDIFGIPRKYSFLHQAGLRKKGRNQVCELKTQENQLLNDRLRAYIIDRPAGTPLCSLSQAIRGQMFSEPVHDRVFSQEILKLLGIAKLQAEAYRTSAGVSLDKPYMADEASATINRLVKEVSPGSDTIHDVQRRSMVLEVGRNSTFPHRFTQYDRQSKEFYTKTETQFVLDNVETGNTENPVDRFAQFVIKRILNAAQSEAGKMAPWEHQFLRVIGLDSEGFLNVSTRTCSVCGSQDPACTRNNLERLHMMIGSSYITILLPASRPKNVDFGRFGAYEVPETGKTEGTFTCESTTYMTRLLIPIFRLIGSHGPFLVSAFDVGCEVLSIDRAIRALGLADALTDDDGFSYLINFIEADFYRNPMHTVIGLPTNLDANYKRGSNAQQLFVIGACTPTDLWCNASTQGQADYHKLNPETSTALELFTFLYHKADASYPRLAVYLTLISSLFLSVNGMEIEDEVRCEALTVCLLEQLVRVSSGHVWRLKTVMDDEYWEIVGHWILDGKIPKAIERTCAGEADLAGFNKKYRIGSFLHTKIEFFVPAPVTNAEEGMANISLSYDPPSSNETAKDFLDLTLTEESVIIEPQVDLPLSEKATLEEIETFIKAEIDNSSQKKLSPDQTDKLLRFIKILVQTEARDRHQAARDRAQKTFKKQSEPLDDVILKATRAKNDSRPRLNGLRAQANQVQEDIAQVKKIAKEADMTREKAQDERQTIKARLKSELDVWAKCISQEAADHHDHLTKLVVENSSDLEAANETLVEIENYTTVKPRRLAEVDQAKVLVPALERPEFIPEREDQDWRKLVALKFRVWKEAKRILKILTEPEIVDLVLATKGKPHMGQLYLRWQKAVDGLEKDHLAWRDIRCIHIGWHVILRTSLPQEGAPVPTDVFRQNAREIKRISDATRRVCFRLLGVPAEEPWSMTWIDSQALNPSQVCKYYDVPVEIYDGEMQKWIRSSNYAHRRAEAGNNVYGVMTATPDDIRRALEARKTMPDNTDDGEVTEIGRVNNAPGLVWSEDVEAELPSSEAATHSVVLSVSHRSLQEELDQDANKANPQPEAAFPYSDVRNRLGPIPFSPLDNSTPRKVRPHFKLEERSASNNSRSHSESQRGGRGGQTKRGRSNSLSKRQGDSTSRGRSNDHRGRGRNVFHRQDGGATSNRSPDQPTQFGLSKRKRKRRKHTASSLERSPKVVATQGSEIKDTGAPKED